MSKTSASLIVDTIFGVAPRYSKEDDKKSRSKVVAGNKKMTKKMMESSQSIFLETKKSVETSLK